MEYLGYFGAVVIGLVLGLIGGGGSILAVPIFIYIFGFDVVTSTALSLFVVGVTSLVGSIGYIKKKLVDFRTAIYFGIPSIVCILFIRRTVLPHLPHYIVHRWGITLTKDMMILILFAVLMIITSYNMIKKFQRVPIPKYEKPNYTLLVTQGIAVGVVTGLIGAGGGFLIVPALVMLVGMEMRNAIATSLFIIAINSTVGVLSSLTMIRADWVMLLVFSAISIIGMFLGMYLSQKIDGKKLKPMFGYFVLGMGIFIIVKELITNQI